MKFEEREILRILRSRSGFVSCSEIANALGVSKALVSKLVNNLRRMGFVIESHPRYGYRLLEVDDLSMLSRYPPDVGIPITVHYLRKCSSTQDVAALLAEEGAEEGTLVVAEEMDKGRGRMGRRWAAPRGGLWFTLVLRPRRLEYLHALSLCMGVAVARAIRNVTEVGVELKWPNDVVFQGKKLGGILVEAKVEADVVRYVLVGVGINVNNELPPELRGFAVSLREVLGRRVARVPLLRACISAMMQYYSFLRDGKLDKVLKEWRNLSCTLGKRVRVSMIDGRSLEGVAEDVDDVGRLVLKLDTGERILIDAGDVEHLG